LVRGFDGGYNNRSRFGDREPEGENAAGFGLAKERDAAVVRFHHQFAEGEAQTHAASKMLSLFSALDKFFKNVVLFGFRNPLTVVPDLDRQLMSVFIKRD